MDSDASFVGREAEGFSANAQGAIPNRIAVEDFTEAVFRAVTRAVDTRKFPLGPIIYGIIWDPQFRNIGRTGGFAEPQAESEGMEPGM